ncbi:MAG TPA: heavy metal translocating P-type ATPase, partial [Peptococcaceae bacterium]|nr:heavy metal translocating P-type ATPase [Peptococcaceae bacterium]
MMGGDVMSSQGCTCTSCTTSTVNPDLGASDLRTDHKKSLLLRGLGCANCAAKMEFEVNKLAEVKFASVDFVAKKLSIHMYNERDLDGITDKVTEIVNNIEPDVEVLEEQGGGSTPAAAEDNCLDKKELFKVGSGAVLFAIAL